jgi:type IV pilus assembly protein PilQ
LNYPDNSFYDFVRSVITSQSTKILASPTLVLSENSEAIMGGAAVSADISNNETSKKAAATIGRPRANESYVTVGEQVVIEYNIISGGADANNSCEPVFGIAGLTFGARISKIDDNGFVTFSISPAITAATRQQLIPNCGPVDILAVRRLDTGSVRVRDGQTLIMTGVISDSDLQTVSKWPILGDLPLIGQFFRSSGGSRDKRELVIMVTPKIINDYEGGNYGYGYQPETRQAREAMRVNAF